MAKLEHDLYVDLEEKERNIENLRYTYELI